jgi:hypothetical protein
VSAAAGIASIASVTITKAQNLFIDFPSFKSAIAPNLTTNKLERTATSKLI